MPAMVIRMAPSVVAAVSSSALVSYLIAGSLFGLPIGQSVLSGLVVSAFFGALICSYRVILDGDQIVTRDVGRRSVPRSEIIALVPDSGLGGRYVRLTTRDGRRRRLRVPITFFALGRARYERDLAKIVQWWSAG